MRKWGALAALGLLASTAACSGVDAGGRPEPADRRVRDLVWGMSDVSFALISLRQESSASIRELGGMAGVVDEGSGLSGYRADTDRAVAAAAGELGVQAPVEALDGLRAEIDRAMGQWEMSRPGFGAAMQPVVGGFDHMADGLLEDAERAIRAVEHPRIRHGLELVVAAERMNLRFDTLIEQLLLGPVDPGDDPDHPGRVVAAWEALDLVAQEVQADGAEPYAGVVAADFPTELHDGLRQAIDDIAASGAVDLAAIPDLMPDRYDESYHDLAISLRESVLDLSS